MDYEKIKEILAKHIQDGNWKEIEKLTKDKDPEVRKSIPYGLLGTLTCPIDFQLKIFRILMSDKDETIRDTAASAFYDIATGSQSNSSNCKYIILAINNINKKEAEAIIKQSMQHAARYEIHEKIIKKCEEVLKK